MGVAANGGSKSAWIVAASIGAVEALKDQGICRWNYTLRSLQQHVRSNIRSFTKVNNVHSSSCSSSSSSSRMASNNNEVMLMMRNEKMKKTEERLKKVMELNSWGPTTVRF